MHKTPAFLKQTASCGRYQLFHDGGPYYIEISTLICRSFFVKIVPIIDV